MAKEFIISSSAHEKKIAIIEDGIVSEYYVERSDESQGLVGNIYKGRVMKVLPGMQSAFVDVGLDRDAFLYVSDFFEEEGIDEFEPFSEPKQPTKTFKEPGQEIRPTLDLTSSSGSYLTVTPEEEEEEEIAEEEQELSVAPLFRADIDDLEDDYSFAPVAKEVVPETATTPATLPNEEEEDNSIEPVAAESDVQNDSSYQEAQVATPTIAQQPPNDFIRIQDDEPEVAVIAETISMPALTLAPEPAEVLPPSQEEAASESEEGMVDTETVDFAALSEADLETPQTKRRRTRKEPAPKKPATPRRRGKKAAESEEAKSDEPAPVVVAPLERIVDDETIIHPKAAEQPLEVRDVPAEAVFEPEVRVGSLQPQLQSTVGFERIVDEDEQSKINNEPLSEDRDTDGGESDDSDSAGNKANLRGIDRRRAFSSRRGGRRRGRRGPPRANAPMDESNSPDNVEFPKEATSQPNQSQPSSVSQPSPSQPSQAVQPSQVSQPSQSPASQPSHHNPLNHSNYSSGGRYQPPGISELLREGQEIIVQIAKEPIALKGARITSHIALPGRYLVYMPTVNHIGVSRKIPSDAERIRLKKTMLALRDREKPQGGFIVRTACEGRTEQELHEDMMYLVRTWQDMKRNAERSKAPTLISRELDLVHRTLRDQLTEEVTAIRVDNESEYARVVDFISRFQPKLVKRVKLYTWKKPIFEEYGVQQEIDNAIKPRVWLKSGGYIVINQTEALVAIDVNTGKFVGRSNRLEDTITKTNIEAAREIVRQIRLRDLGGIIVLDLIDMDERKNRFKVMQVLEAELRADRSPSKVLQFNDFGLVAITRKRVRQSLERTLCSPCSYCQGSGLIKSPQTVCYEILAEARRIASESDIQPTAEALLRVSPEVAEALRSTELGVFSEIEAYLGCHVIVKGDTIVHQERFDFAFL